jgi:integrase
LSYLRICHGIKITVDDVKDYISFPKARKDPRQPISIETLKKLFNNADPQRRALYYTLVTSGMRISEALSLTKKNFHFDEHPVRITLEAENTKTKEGRETYITSEAYEKLKPLLETKKENERIFTWFRQNFPTSTPQ